MTTKDEALKLALEALELNNDEWKSLADFGDSGYWKAEDRDHYQQTNKAIAALREALNAPLAEQKSGIKQVIELYDSPEQPAPVAKPHEQESVCDDDVCVACGMEHCECGEKDD